jgi:hypothetical protein
MAPIRETEETGTLWKYHHPLRMAHLHCPAPIGINYLIDSNTYSYIRFALPDRSYLSSWMTWTG